MGNGRSLFPGHSCTVPAPSAGLNPTVQAPSLGPASLWFRPRAPVGWPEATPAGGRLGPCWDGGPAAPPALRRAPGSSHRWVCRSFCSQQLGRGSPVAAAFGEVAGQGCGRTPSDADAPWSPAGRGRQQAWAVLGQVVETPGLPPAPSSPAIGVAARPPARPGTPWRAASPTHETPALGPLGTRRGELAGAQRGASEAAGGGPSVQGEQVRLALSRAAPAEWTWRPTRGPPRGRSRVRTPCAVVPEGSAFGGGRRARTCPCVTLRLSPHGLFMPPAGGGGAGAGGRAAADLWHSWDWSRRLSPRALGTFRSRHLPGRWSGWGHEICFGGEGPERPPHPHWSPLPGGGQECQLQGTEPETSPWPSEGFLGEWPVAGQMWPLGSIDKVRVRPQGLHPEHRKAESVSGSEG